MRKLMNLVDMPTQSAKHSHSDQYMISVNHHCATAEHPKYASNV